MNQLGLYGITELLPGNENKIIACLPVVILPDNRIAIARNLQWQSVDHDLTILGTREQVEERITSLHLADETQIQPNNLVVLLGPTLCEYLQEISAEASSKFLQNTIPIQSSFRIYIAQPAAYGQFLHDLLVFSKYHFDNELELTGLGEVSHRAKAALEVLKANGTTTPEDYYTRLLAVARIQRDSDAFRNYLELASIDTDQTPEVLERWLDNFLWDRISRARIAAPNILALTPRLFEIKISEDIGLRRYVKKLAQSDWTIYFRYSNYFTGKFFERGTPQECFLNFLWAMKSEIMRLADELNIEGSGRIKIRPLDAQNLDTLIDEVFTLEILQSEPGFGSVKRVKERGTMIAIGNTQTINVIVPSKWVKEFQAYLPAETPRLSEIFNFCNDNQYMLITQQSTSIQDEIEILKKKTIESDTLRIEFESPSQPKTIRGILLSQQSSKRRALAVIDQLVVSKILGKRVRLQSFPARLDAPQPVGYFIPKGDPLYASAILNAINAAFRYPTGQWREDFAKLMKSAHITLFPHSPTPMKLDPHYKWVQYEIHELQISEAMLKIELPKR